MTLVISDHVDTTPSAGRPGAIDVAELGPLADLVADPSVTDVLVNGPAEIWVDRGVGLQPVPDARFANADDLRRFAVRLAATCGRRLDEASPWVDAQLPDGTRLHAVLPPIAVRGPYLSLRTLRRQSIGLAALVGLGTLTADSARIVEAIVRARLAYVVSGGTGSGKTTLLAALLSLVSVTERIVIVEEAPELTPDHPHVVSLQCRQSNVEGAGAVSLRDLVRTAMRMRPDRLVVGECRGAEVIDLLGALNTGHDGGACTVHANTAADVPVRFEALGMLGGLSRSAVQAQVVAALSVVLHLSRAGRLRYLDEIGLIAAERDAVVVRSAWHYLHGPGPAAVDLGRLLARRGVLVPAVLGGRR
ncbi:MAG: TadA family conjugal transfer-associated ATPase [Micromonosporaceae bacterium]|nr:TadA family conjugal transfer-associated ATPase [Micromonosporaceae bacterium]